MCLVLICRSADQPSVPALAWLEPGADQQGGSGGGAADMTHGLSGHKVTLEVKALGASHPEQVTTQGGLLVVLYFEGDGISWGSWVCIGRVGVELPFF